MLPWIERRFRISGAPHRDRAPLYNSVIAFPVVLLLTPGNRSFSHPLGICFQRDQHQLLIGNRYWHSGDRLGLGNEQFTFAGQVAVCSVSIAA